MIEICLFMVLKQIVWLKVNLVAFRWKKHVFEVKDR